MTLLSLSLGYQPRRSNRPSAGCITHWNEMAFKLHTVWLLMLCLACTADAAELKQKTAEAFERYIRATEARMLQESSPWQPFLWIDRMPEQRREVFYTKLREGQTYVEHLETDQNGESI